MNQVEFAVHQTAHGTRRGDLADMAKYLGIGEQVLRNKVNPEQEQSRLYFDEFIRMMRKDGDLRILYAIAAEFGCTLAPPGCKVTPTVVNALLEANADNGDLTREVVDAMADGKITQAELARTRERINVARTALDGLEQSLIAKAAE